MSELWRERRVLITGVTGLVGSWLAARLVEEGALVVGLVLDADPQSELLRSGTHERIHVVNGDLTNAADVNRAFSLHRPDTVFHLGAQTQVRAAYRDPVATWEANVRGTWHTLEACRKNADLVQRVVFASSDKAYGVADELPYTEDTPLAAVYPYDASKACAELVARSFATTYELPVVVARCGNIFGGGDLNWERLVPGTIRSLLRDEAPLIRSDGKMVRDYIYVEDVVDAYLQLADAPGRGLRAFNISNERALSVLDMVALLSDQMGKAIEPRVLNEAVAEIPEQTLSAAKARAELSWEPRFSIEEGLARTVAWYARHLGGDGGASS